MKENQKFDSNQKQISGQFEVTGNYVNISGEQFYCIKNYDCMPPFFMSIVSSSDHWFFISSTGGLSFGRKNAESAVFPYYTDDKITENYHNTGSLSILKVEKNDSTHLWEPFQPHTNFLFQTNRNIYKNIPGNILIFEEINVDLELSISVKWQTNEKFGFIKTTTLKNFSNEEVHVGLLDGLQNLLPYGANTSLQNTFSNLLNAYKRSELDSASGIGIFALNSSLSDLAEPSESLKATIAWQTGIENPLYLLSTTQVNNFKYGQKLHQETDIRGLRGAFFVSSEINISKHAEKEWNIITDVNQDLSDILRLKQLILNNSIDIEKEILIGVRNDSLDLIKIIAGADGLQYTRNEIISSHHFSNVLFNVMRGGTFFEDYKVSKNEFINYLQVKNKNIFGENEQFLAELPLTINCFELTELAINKLCTNSLIRSSFEYLPLSFSRRHGDPSRPWNKFSINLKNADGSRRQDYEGNWRDIFQNWEALAASFPEYIEGMIFKFLNATTVDGYNPYRITKENIDWEKPEPGNPWANIGYWGDHQIIYLLKLLQASHKFHPGFFQKFLDKEVFSFAYVPYKINDYEKMIEDPFQTIIFDQLLNDRIDRQVEAIGTDGKLFANTAGEIYQANLFEKLLSLLLAKISNFVPGGGIWMNTQRPEWNDANNALVGKGLSVVTTSYLLSFIRFFNQILQSDQPNSYYVSEHFFQYYIKIKKAFSEYPSLLISNIPISPELRKKFMDRMGDISSDFRSLYYTGEFSFQKQYIEKSDFIIFLDLVYRVIECTLRANKRDDELFHSYNTLTLSQTSAQIGFLTEMLEGQVSILSSGILSIDETLILLRNLRMSRLFREDQNTYILYPDRDLPGFLSKNTFSFETASRSKLLIELIKQGENSVVQKDVHNGYHFSGNFRNNKDLQAAINDLTKSNAEYSGIISEDMGIIFEIFESVFDHKSFTGRSGSFFAYEGLGSIYWHMVAKLLLAVQDNIIAAIKNKIDPNKISELLGYYDEIRNGLGFTKTPAIFGAFPSDPYSHTPAGQGAKQPGMTGQVKEEILTRQIELGIIFTEGKIEFWKELFRQEDLAVDISNFNYFNINKESVSISIEPGSMAFTICQVPFIVMKSEIDNIHIYYSNGKIEEFPGSLMPEIQSSHIFRRDNSIFKVEIRTKFN